MPVSNKILITANASRWENAKILPSKKRSFVSVAKRLVSAKERYQDIEKSTGVPWFVIAVIHQRESSQDWSRSLAQGDPWNRKSTHVPKGRGPFNSFKEAAIDALKNCAPRAARWKDWSPGGTMTILEKYNGLGYANKGRPSPYIWAGTDQYMRGKYVADGVYDPNEVDQQLGCAGMILAMQELDDSISFEAEKAPKEVILAPLSVLSVQKRLAAMNYNPSWIDDKWGGRTAGAISSFLNDRQSKIVPPTSKDTFVAVLPELRAELTKAENEQFTRPMSSDLKKADPKTVSEVAPEAVPTRRNFLTSAWAAVVAFISAIGTAISEYISSVFTFYDGHKDSIPTDSGFFTRAWSYVEHIPTSVWIAVVGCLFVYIAINAMISARHTIDAVKTGARQ